MVDRLKEAWKLYRSVAKDKLELHEVSDEKKTDVSVCDLRELIVFPPIYFAVVEESLRFDAKKLFRCVVLTEEVELGWINKSTPVIPLYSQRSLLVCLPFWVYLDERFLCDYTVKRGKLDENVVVSIVNYANSVSIPSDIRGDYMRHVMGLLAPYNTTSMLAFIDEMEN
jgi:hypothetical protein